MKSRKRLLAVEAKDMLVLPQGGDPTVTIQRGLAGSCGDNFIVQASGYENKNNGGNTQLEICSYSNWNYFNLLKFDFSSDVPVGSTIDLATFSMYKFGTFENDPVGRTYWAYRLLPTDWVEGTVSWDIQAGSSCWNYRVYNTLPWDTAGASTVGTDYTTTDGVSSIVPATNNWQNWTVTAQVQTALDNISGVWHCKVQDGTLDSAARCQAHYHSSEYTTDTSLRPKLYIEYTEPTAAFMSTNKKYW